MKSFTLRSDTVTHPELEFHLIYPDGLLPKWMGIHGEDLAPDFDSDYDGSDSDSGGSGGEGAAGRKRGRRKRRKKRAAGTGGTGDTGEEEDASESGERNFTEYSIQINSIQSYDY